MALADSHRFAVESLEDQIAIGVAVQVAGAQSFRRNWRADRDRAGSERTEAETDFLNVDRAFVARRTGAGDIEFAIAIEICRDPRAARTRVGPQKACGNNIRRRRWNQQRREGDSAQARSDVFHFDLHIIRAVPRRRGVVPDMERPCQASRRRLF